MTELLNYILCLIAFLVALFTLPGTIELLFLTIGSLLPTKKSAVLNLSKEKTAVIVPAHNEETVIRKTLESLKRCEGDFDTVVVADNCSDQTVKVAKEYGVIVHERHNTEKQGKGYALQEAFDTLLKEPYTSFIIVDADTILTPDCITSIQQAITQGANAVQVRDGVLNPESSWRSRLMHVAFMAFHHLRAKGRSSFGLSAGLCGNGFALSRKTVEEVPYHIDSVVEDLAYHLELVKAGKKVIYIGDSAVFSVMPTSSSAAVSQRTRWEGGRLRLALDQVPELIKSIVQGNFRLIEPLFDLLSLPLAYHCALLLVLLLIPFTPLQLYALFALFVVVTHLITALIIGGGSYKDFLILFTAPAYIIWKLLILFKIIKASSTDTPWVRTSRRNK